MKVTFLTQAGFLIETSSAKIILDPYLSDSVGKKNPAKSRRVPVDGRFLDLHPDFLLFTHDHLDHFDPETAEHYFKNGAGIAVLCPRSVWEKARLISPLHNYILMEPGTRWTEKGVVVQAVRAFHSDPDALGFLISAEGKTLYFTGDTLYNDGLFTSLPAVLDAVFFPANGAGNNMNFEDAALFAALSGAKRVFPCHCGLLDSIDLSAFPAENKEILAPYQSVEI